MSMVQKKSRPSVTWDAYVYHIILSVSPFSRESTKVTGKTTEKPKHNEGQERVRKFQHDEESTHPAG